MNRAFHLAGGRDELPLQVPEGGRGIPEGEVRARAPAPDLEDREIEQIVRRARP